MPRSSTIWTADTCGCSIEYYNDTQSYCRSISSCNKHSSLLDTEEHLSEVLQHNRSRNLVLNELVSVYEIDLEKDPIFVGYDESADVSDDPIIIVGLDQALKRKSSTKTEKDVIAEIREKFHKNVVSKAKAGVAI